MQEKKILHKQNAIQQKQTVEAYLGSCICWPFMVNCNPCGSVPSTAYLDLQDTRLRALNYKNKTLYW